MVAGYHLIWTVYGYWLPNDPRGSTSTEIRVEPIRPLGDIHYGRKPVQPWFAEIRAFHEQARDILKHPVLTFDDDEIALVGKTIGEAVAERGTICHACAVMPDHAHLLIRRQGDRAEDMIQLFQETTRAALIGAGKRAATHPVWTAGAGWKGFLNTQRDFLREIEYIGRNPLKIGRPEQDWDFVVPYDGWLPTRSDFFV